MRDAFGRLLSPPESLPRAARVDELRRVAGRLLADHDAAAQWLGRSLMTWVQAGGDLPRILGVRPERGSHATVQAAVRQAEVDSLLLRLSTACGSDSTALRMLRGDTPTCGQTADLVRRLRDLKAPSGPDAIRRSRRRARHRE